MGAAIWHDGGPQAAVAELADAHGSGPCPRKWVGVQLPPAALLEPRYFQGNCEKSGSLSVLLHALGSSPVTAFTVFARDQRACCLIV